MSAVKARRQLLSVPTWAKPTVHAAAGKLAGPGPGAAQTRTIKASMIKRGIPEDILRPEAGIASPARLGNG
jgi:hypothetical protein